MTTRAEIIGSGPGTATIRILSNEIRTPIEAFQIQRNQMPDAYLAPTGGWQTSPDQWIALSPGDVSAAGDGFTFNIGPTIVDPIVSALTRSTFRLCLRGGGKTASLALTTAALAPLLSSGAKARATTQPVEPTLQPAVPPPKLAPTPEIPTITPPERIVPPVVPSVRRLPARLIAAIIALVVLAAAWLYRDDIMTMFNGSEIQPGGGNLSLREELKQVMATNPTAEALVQKADSMAAEGKGEGALYLYRQAIDKGSMGAALALGKFYDPTEPANSNSTTTSAETASFWYAKAANVNIAEAQRRLGLLQVRNGPGSATFDMGVENLKKASDQGDSAATNMLEELGQ